MDALRKSPSGVFVPNVVQLGTVVVTNVDFTADVPPASRSLVQLSNLAGENLDIWVQIHIMGDGALDSDLTMIPVLNGAPIFAFPIATRVHATQLESVGFRWFAKNAPANSLLAIGYVCSAGLIDIKTQTQVITYT